MKYFFIVQSKKYEVPEAHNTTFSPRNIPLHIEVQKVPFDFISPQDFFQTVSGFKLNTYFWDLEAGKFFFC